MNKLLLLIIVGSALIACEQLIEIDPPKNELVKVSVFSNDETANAAALGIYSRMASTSHSISSTGGSSLKSLTSQSSDECNSFPGISLQFFENEILPNNSLIRAVWRDSYNSIYMTNAVLEGLELSPISHSLKQQMEGEARFLRAFFYFYLVNLFGDVPLIISTDYRINRLASRAPVDQVYELIKGDLIKAQNLLSVDYSYSSNERIRANQAAATALLARVYLYTKEWENAETEATKIINNPLYQILTNLNQVFLANSAEAIWQLLPTSTSGNAPEGRTPKLPNYGPLTSHLLNAFETNDLRKSEWTTTIGAYTYNAKYKASSTSPRFTEYSTVLRLAEQYLIRAEARAQQGNLTGAREDIDVIRARAGLLGTSAVTQDELLIAIEQEKRIEFFNEYGHRWLDLKRWERANEVLGPIKLKWDPTDVLYPIPENELLRAPNLTQNQGY